MAQTNVRLRQRRANHLELVLTGEIDIASRRQLDRAVHLVRETLPDNVYVDVHGVTFFAAAAVTFLDRLHEVAAAHGLRLLIGPMPPCVTRVMALTETASPATADRREPVPAATVNGTPTAAHPRPHTPKPAPA